MDKEKITRGNVDFFKNTIAPTLQNSFFIQAVLGSIHREREFPTDITGKPGLILIDSSDMDSHDRFCQICFFQQVRSNLLRNVASKFNGPLIFKGELCEKLTFKESGYLFAFEVSRYRRSFQHRFKEISASDLEKIPNDENLERIVCLKIELIPN